MAVFRWLTTIGSADITASLSGPVQSLGMEINAGASGSDQLFAVMPVDRSVRNGAMVSLLANWSNKGRREIQLEIRSDEPMLRRSTRCQRVSNLLQQQLRPA